MSASSLMPPTQRRHQLASAPRGPRTRPVLTSVLVGMLLSSLTGCSGDAQGTAAPPSPSAVTSSSASSTSRDEQAALLAQYRKFWVTLTPASRTSAAQRRLILAEVAVDPALKSILAGFSQADTKRQVLYGQNVPRPTVRISPDATTALVDDCQDSTRAGVADRATGRELTHGVARNHLSVTMKKTEDGLWKLAFVDYTKTPC